MLTSQPLLFFSLCHVVGEDLQTETDNPNELDPEWLPSNDITAISQTKPSHGQVTFNLLEHFTLAAGNWLIRAANHVPGANCTRVFRSGSNIAGRTGQFIITGRRLATYKQEPPEVEAIVVSNDTLEAKKNSARHYEYHASVSSSRVAFNDQEKEASITPTLRLIVPVQPDLLCAPNDYQ